MCKIKMLVRRVEIFIKDQAHTFLLNFINIFFQKFKIENAINFYVYDEWNKNIDSKHFLALTNFSTAKNLKFGIRVR
jgi:hypothetical protein